MDDGAGARPEGGHITEHVVAGGGGCKLHVVETGNRNGRPILFIHGFSLCSLVWSRQFESDLARDFRLVALDMRGHGQSARPHDAYGDTRLWADDLDAVLNALSLVQPILSGWSYGCLPILDYVRHYGDASIGGIQFVGGISQLGSDAAMSALDPEFAAMIPDLLSGDIDLVVQGLTALAYRCFRDLPSRHLYKILGAAVSTPRRVRNEMFARTLDNDDLLARLRKPVLVTHGSRDAVVRPTIADRHHALIANAQVHLLESGHAPFWDDAIDFNQRLREFAEELDRAAS